MYMYNMTLYALYYYVCIQLVLYATDLQSLTNSKCIHNYSVYTRIQ